MSMICIGLIIAIIILVRNNNDLQQQNLFLKNLNNQKINFCPKCGFKLNMHNNNCNSQVNINNNITTNNNKVEVNNKKLKPEKDIKNNLMLITGSIMIILAAIIFLTSTWSVINNVFKTIVLIIMLGVFYGMSYIAKKHFKLEQTSKTFYIISLAYIPIIFLAVYLFSLFGSYLSVNGSGKYLYLTISSFLVHIIYYYCSKKENNSVLAYFSILFQMSSIIFLMQMIKNSFTLVLFGLLIYSVIMIVLYLCNKYYFKKDLHIKVCKLLFVSLTTLIIGNNLFNRVEIISIISTIILLVNTYLIFVKADNNEKIYSYLYPLIIIFIFNTISCMIDIDIVKQAIILVSFIVVYIYDILKQGKISIISYVEIFIFFIIYNFIWGVNYLLGSQILDYYIIFGWFSILSFMYSFYSDRYKSFSASLFCISAILSVFSLTVKFELPFYIVGYCSYIFIIISMFINCQSLKNPIKYVSIISLFLTLVLIEQKTNIFNIILYLISFLSMFIYWIKKKDEVYKIASYISVNAMLLLMLKYLNIDKLLYIIPATTILFIIIEEIFTILKSKTSHIYIIIQTILSIILLNCENNTLGLLSIILLSIVFTFYIIKNNVNEKYLYISFLGIIPYVYFEQLFMFDNFNIMYIVSCIVLLGTAILIYFRKTNMYILLYYLYAILHFTCLGYDSYIEYIIFIAGSVICYLIKDNKIKDLYKGLAYFFVLLLLNEGIVDLKLNIIAVFTYGIYILFCILYTRTIFNKYTNKYKILEYLFISIINLTALFNYTNEYDGMLYVLFLLVIVIICYFLKLGPVFLTCLIFIIINAFLLTRAFWFAVPWWIYILSLGGVLIGFAIYNEVRDKTNPNKRLKNIKEKLDL